MSVIAGGFPLCPQALVIPDKIDAMFAVVVEVDEDLGELTLELCLAVAGVQELGLELVYALLVWRGMFLPRKSRP